MMDWLLLATGFTGALTMVHAWHWVQRRFGVSTNITAHYSPKGGCTDTVVRELAQARREILVQAFSFTSRPIAQALVDARKRGVHIEIILDPSNEQDGHSDLPYLLENGLNPVVDSQHALAHNKVMILDRRTVITGSFNFTNQAEHENAENLLVIKGHAEVLSSYRKNFLEHKAHSKPVSARPSQPARPAPAPEARAPKVAPMELRTLKTAPTEVKASRIVQTGGASGEPKPVAAVIGPAPKAAAAA